MSRLTGFVNVPVMPQSIGKIVRFGILIPSILTKCLAFESLVLSMFLVILEVWFCILDFWVWIWSVVQKKQMIKKGEKTKKEEKIHCLQGANPVLLGGLAP